MSASSTSIKPVLGWTLSEWRHYQGMGNGLERLQALLDMLDSSDTAWISVITPEVLHEEWQRIESLKDAASLPLYGVPIAVKDNIDVTGFRTTAACPAFAYTPDKDATVIERLKALGAIIIGKTNLDQFATGLVGTRSPYGAVPNTFDDRYVSGGSSSGSASAVARGLVPVSLGTDTAGSGRVPAGFNNIVGLKPTRGRFSNHGLVPACRSIDCISIFALTVSDAAYVANLLAVYDSNDPYSRQDPCSSPVAMPARPRIGVPDQLTFYNDEKAQYAFNKAVDRLKQMGAELVEIDFTPFAELAAELYQGAWVAERTAALSMILQHHPEALDPTVREIVMQGTRYSAVDAYDAEYRRAGLKRQIDAALAQVDALVVPTSPTIHTREEMAQEPIAYNSHFGTYTNFTNLADLSALALPADFRTDALPAGITLIAPAWHDSMLASFGVRWERELNAKLGATQRAYAEAAVQSYDRVSTPGVVEVAVVGAHLSGMPLNHQLTERSARLVSDTTTSANYRLFALNNTVPAKPGLVRGSEAEKGQSISVEVWQVPTALFGSFVAEVPAPLGIGNVELADGRWVKGFICEGSGLVDAQDITGYGGWRDFVASTRSVQPS